MLVAELSHDLIFNAAENIALQVLEELIQVEGGALSLKIKSWGSSGTIISWLMANLTSARDIQWQLKVWNGDIGSFIRPCIG